MPNYYEDVYAIVERIPAGAVTTYGRIAAMTPVPNGAAESGGRSPGCRRTATARCRGGA